MLKAGHGPRLCNYVSHKVMCRRTTYYATDWQVFTARFMKHHWYVPFRLIWGRVPRGRVD